jgi:hypothetical protein
MKAGLILELSGFGHSTCTDEYEKPEAGETSQGQHTGKVYSPLERSTRKAASLMTVISVLGYASYELAQNVVF